MVEVASSSPVIPTIDTHSKPSYKKIMGSSPIEAAISFLAEMVYAIDWKSILFLLMCLVHKNFFDFLKKICYNIYTRLRKEEK